MDEKKLDYTKYRLKPEDEIRKIARGISELNLVLCGKCFKEFETDNEPECSALKKIIKDCGISLSSCASIPFLCNTSLSCKVLDGLREKIPVGVAACGIGIQFVADYLKDRKVFAFADTLPQSGNATSIRGYHGIALGVEKCASCGECRLDMTGGICPVEGCAKGLLNGPCGGASDEGMCEVNPQVRCVWIEIFDRLKKQGRDIVFPSDAANYGIFRIEEKERISILNREKRMEGFYGGLYPDDRKGDAEGIKIKPFPEPGKVCLFLSQHAGLPAIPSVKKGDRVKKWQKIAGSGGFISSAVHSSVSGRVLAFEEKRHPVSQEPAPSIIIENDGLNTRDESAIPLGKWETLSREDILDFLQDKGLVGLGGAMFPSPAKLCPPKSVDTLIINGCECEPCLNGDNRTMIENPREVLEGAGIARKLLCAENMILAVEDNKPEAFEKLSLHEKDFPGLKIAALKTKYPQGAERMLVKKVTGRDVPPGSLPFDAGVVVFNVATLYALYRAVCEGEPLVERVVTVGGEGALVKENFRMKLGTLFSDIAGYCLAGGNDAVKNYDVRMGGPMMGILQKDVDSAVIKGTTGILFLAKPLVEASAERDCIKCGRCADVCPMELYPHFYAYYGKKGSWEKAAEHGVRNCIECGCCQYICSSKIDLLGYIRKAKKYADNKT